MSEPNLPLDTNRPASSLIRVGLIGSGIQASASPGMHMEEAKQNGLRLNYELLDLDFIPEGASALPRLLDESERSGFVGLNITHPCKQTVIQYLSELSEDARALGAVNAITFRNGKRTGHNTDWYGFAESFKRGMPDASIQIVTQLGTGGAGSAVAYAMLKMGVGTLYLFDTDQRKAEGLADTLVRNFDRSRIKVIDRITNQIELSYGLINTTPIGMAKYPGTPIPAKFLRPSLWFAEVIYFPLETELLKIARSTGCRTIDGGGMAVFQAVESFRLFTGITPDSARILKWFRQHFQPPA